MRAAGAPVTWSAEVSGAEVNAALWPGMSNVTPLAPPPATAPSGPSPGKPDSDGGAPPGGGARGGVSGRRGGAGGRDRGAGGAGHPGIRAGGGDPRLPPAGGRVDAKDPGHRETGLAGAGCEGGRGGGWGVPGPEPAGEP